MKCPGTFLTQSHTTQPDIFIFFNGKQFSRIGIESALTRSTRENGVLVYTPTYLSALKSEIMGREKVFGFWTRAYNHNRLEYFLCNHHLLRVCIHLGLK